MADMFDVRSKRG